MSVSDLVGEIDDVRRRTRAATRGGAVPLAMLGLLVLAATPFYAAAANFLYVGRGYVQVIGGGLLTRPTFVERLLRAHPNAYPHLGVGRYWLVAMPLAFAAVTAYYALRARRSGLSVNGWRVAATGGGLLALIVAVMATAAVVPGALGDYFGPSDVLNPFLVVVVAILVLARVERSVAILVAGLVFAVAVVAADALVYTDVYGDAWDSWRTWGWATLALGVLLLAEAGAVALVRRPRA
ncbi:MAG TPA: hypothetical protein VGX28_16225 [Frankiaceae bacterium]|jgi:hypothetical protein|nr:hypothetical protein [Frankiaceae bacterium]